ncbi:hypothetical protein EYV94_24955 [Puteibacter caeruleilacunae]|nr:hypothetical protein EYV94_24955 [Puteibacter caeruleilacunae]
MKNIMYLLLLSSFILNSCSTTKKEEINFGVMSFNMWVGGENGKQPLSQTVRCMELSGASIVGAQETHGNGKPRPDNSVKMAETMNWNHVDLGHYDAVLTKFKVVERDHRALKIEVAKEKYIWFINTHLHYIPYQPYQLNDKKYGEYPFISTEEEAIKWAKEARGHQVDELVKLVERKKQDGIPIIVTGDFNEPSHQDWTAAAAEAGICKTKVEWPSTKALTDIGMVDAYREKYPDEVKKTGFTWSSLDKEGEIHDRIDFIFYWGEQLQLKNAFVIGEMSDLADIGIEQYPSDHRAVVARFIWK